MDLPRAARRRAARALEQRTSPEHEDLARQHRCLLNRQRADIFHYQQLPMSRAPGEFEILVLLCLLRGHESGGSTASDLRRRLQTEADRDVSRGALYATLDRLDDKEWIRWVAAQEEPDRGGIPARRALVTESGVEVVRARSKILRTLMTGLERWMIAE
jgi:DNA-binding PadR family transcriptional regulator